MILGVMIQGGHIYVNRVRDIKINPVVKIHAKTLSRLKVYFKKQKNGYFVLDEMKIVGMHNGRWLKKEYLKNANKGPG
jgi:hypothetical protein